MTVPDSTDTDRIAELRSQHKRAVDHEGDENGFDSTIEFCAYCGNDEWPCDLAHLLSLVEQLQGQLDEQRYYGEQLQMSLDSCSGNHLEIPEYDPEESS